MTTLTNDQVTALNTLIAVAQRAQSRGVLSLDEAAITLAAIRVFVPEAPESPPEQVDEENASEASSDDASEEK